MTDGRAAIPGGPDLALAIRLALREMRSGLKGFRIFLACLSVGVAVIAGVGTLTTAIHEGLQQEGQSLLGGDVELALTQRPVRPDELDYLARAGTVSTLVSLRGMAHAPRSDTRTLVELRSVDNSYPLYGEVQLEGAHDLTRVLERKDTVWGVAVAPELADRLALKTGDRLIMGKTSYEVRAILVKTPDASSGGLQLAPAVLVSLDSLSETGLVQIGSLVRYYYRIKLASDQSAADFKTQLTRDFPDAGWRIRDRDNGAPGVQQFVDRMGLFLTLVGLTALVVGGVGVGNAVRVHLDSRTNTIATLKVVGATGNMIFAIYLMQVMLLAAIGIAMGVMAGAVAPVLFQGLLAARLPVPPVFSFYPLPLLLAAAYGGLITLIFSIWPLAKARDIPAAGLFRSLITGRKILPRWPYLVSVFGASLLLVAIATLFSGNPQFTARFIGAALASLLILVATGWLIRRMAAALPRSRHPGLRIAIANLHRPGSATGAVVLSLGLGLTLFTAIAQIEGNLDNQVAEQLPGESPAFFFIDIQKDQIDDFRQQAKNLSNGIPPTVVPYLRGRITALNNVPIAEANVAPDAQWAIRGDRGLTYAETLPAGNKLISGDWWRQGYDGPAEISFDAELARGMGLTVGDTMTVNVLGRDITARIASLREINWGTLGVNFAIVFDPHTLRPAPHTYLATLKLDSSREAEAYRALTRAFPNVSAVRMKEVLESVNKLLEDVSNVVSLTAMLTILSGILVLAGAVAAGQSQRRYDSVILKILGATRADVLRTFILEYALLGGITGLVALALGTAGAYAVITGIMDLTWVYLPGIAIATAFLSLALTVGFGLAGTWAALNIRPGEALRQS